jgi:hypothetical protein
MKRAFLIVGKLWRGAEFCQSCAVPVVEFLKVHNLLEKADVPDLQLNPEAL